MISDSTWRISKEINVAHLLVNVLVIGIAWGMVTTQITNLQANKAEAKDVAVLTTKMDNVQKNSEETKASLSGLTIQVNTMIQSFGGMNQELHDWKEAVRSTDFKRK